MWARLNRKTLSTEVMVDNDFTGKKTERKLIVLQRTLLVPQVYHFVSSFTGGPVKKQTSDLGKLIKQNRPMGGDGVWISDEKCRWGAKTEEERLSEVGML